MRRISLALTLHNHQPVGNFGWVVDEVAGQAYEPMIAALEAHPTIRLGLHYTGPLLEWLVAERPELVGRVRALVERDQVEILGGGLYEPILVALPERDRLGQLSRMAETVEATFGRRPTGAWLAERVWEPNLPVSLAGAGYRWTILDDSHFRAAAIPEDGLWGPYVTEDQGNPLTVFGTEQGLRYLLPFHEVDEVIAHLRENATEAGDRLGTMGDDGEKFGAWPGTFEHCWGKDRWVERFFDAIEANADWLTTVRPGDWLAEHAPIGRVYVPTGSYAEMGEWALPAEEGRAFGSAVRSARERDGAEARWLRGAFWRNFQVKYREVNDLHKQMLRVSAKVDALPAGSARDEAVDLLHRGQSNDAYWHGLFGGIYLPHLRTATLANLIRAEDLADGPAGEHDGSLTRDLDLDSRDEVRLATDGQVVVVKPDEGAGIGSWDLRAPAHALAAVLRRRPEAYHETLRRHEAGLASKGRRGTAAAPASIHEMVQVKEAGLAGRLVYDAYERRSGLLRVLPADAAPGDWAAGGRGDMGDFVDGPFRIEQVGDASVVLVRDGSVSMEDAAVSATATVELRVGGTRLQPTLEQRLTLRNTGDAPLPVRLGIEWATMMLGGGGNPQAWWDVCGTRSSHDGSGSVGAVTELAQGNDWLGVEVRTVLGSAMDAWWAPIETVSNSEGGFERVYQGSALLLSSLATLQPGEAWTAILRHEATARPDFPPGEP